MATPALHNKKDFYCKVLGLGPDPCRNDIRSTYKALALKWHPDRHKTNKEHAKDRFIEINTAYQALLNMFPGDSSTSASSPASSFDSMRSAFYSQSAQGSHSSQTSFTPSSPRSTPCHDFSRDNLHEPTSDSKRHKSKRSHHRENRSRSNDNHHSKSSDRERHSNDGRRSEKTEHRSEKGDHHSHSSKDRRTKSSKHHHHGHHERHEHDNKHKRASVVDEDEEEEEATEESTPEQRPPTVGVHLRASHLAGSQNSDWLFPLPLTLEELHSGTSYRFQITRQLLPTPNPSCESLHSSFDSAPSSVVHIDLEIPPGGYKNGTQIRYEGLGNQRKSDGSFQDIVFVIQEIIHDRFARVQDDLVARIELTWDEGTLREDLIFIDGLDGESVAVPIPASLDSDKETRIPKAGMPIRNAEGRTIGRGDLVIKWDFVVIPEKTTTPKSRWQAFKSAFSWQHHNPAS